MSRADFLIALFWMSTPHIHQNLHEICESFDFFKQTIWFKIVLRNQIKSKYCQCLIIQALFILGCLYDIKQNINIILTSTKKTI